MPNKSISTFSVPEELAKQVDAYLRNHANRSEGLRQLVTDGLQTEKFRKEAEMLNRELEIFKTHESLGTVPNKSIADIVSEQMHTEKLKFEVEKEQDRFKTYKEKAEERQAELKEKISDKKEEIDELKKKLKKANEDLEEKEKNHKKFIKENKWVDKLANAGTTILTNMSGTYPKQTSQLMGMLSGIPVENTQALGEAPKQEPQLSEEDKQALGFGFAILESFKDNDLEKLKDILGSLKNHEYKSHFLAHIYNLLANKQSYTIADILNHFWKDEENIKTIKDLLAEEKAKDTEG